MKLTTPRHTLISPTSPGWNNFLLETEEHVALYEQHVQALYVCACVLLTMHNTELHSRDVSAQSSHD